MTSYFFFFCAEPSLVLPTLVDHVYSLHEKVQLLASDTLLAVLKIHKDEPKVLCMLLDCLRYVTYLFDKNST